MQNTEMSEVETALFKNVNRDNELMVKKCVDGSVDYVPGSMRYSEVKDNVNDKLGRRRKCKSAVVLLGLVKSRARLAKKACSSRVYQLDNLYAPQKKKIAKRQVCAVAVSRKTVQLEKRNIIPVRDYPFVNADSAIKKEWLMPFDLGWRREVVHRGTSKLVSSSKPNADVYYFAPGQIKLRSMPEIVEYLKRVNSSLSSDCFTFNKEPIHHEPYEVVRLAGVPKGRKTASDASTHTVIQSRSEVLREPAKSLKPGCNSTAGLSAVSSNLKPQQGLKKALAAQSSSVSRLSKSTTKITVDCRRSAKIRLKLTSNCRTLCEKMLAAELSPKNSNVPSLSSSSNLHKSSVQYSKVLDSVSKPCKTPISFKPVVTKERKQPAKCVISIDTGETTRNLNGPSVRTSDDLVSSEPSLSAPDLHTSTQTESGSSGLSKPKDLNSNDGTPSALSQIDMCITVTSCSITEVQQPASSNAKNTMLRKLDSKTTLLMTNSSIADSTKSTSCLDANFVMSSKSISNTSLGFRPCGLDCSGRFGVPPSLYCIMCMSVFHPECAGFSYFAHKFGFCCKLCQQLQNELICTKYSSHGRSMLSHPDVSNNNAMPSTQHSADVSFVDNNSTLSSERRINKSPKNDGEKTCSAEPSVVSEKESESFGNVAKILESVVSSSMLGADSALHQEPLVCSLVNCESGDTNDENQIVILPGVLQCMIRMSLPLEVWFENRRIVLPSSDCKISEMGLVLSLPREVLSSEYLTGSTRPFICEIVPCNANCNQVLKICSMTNNV